jgi:hypothetical protein
VVGNATITAGPEGQFQVSVELNADASVSSGLKALMIRSFDGQEMEVLTGTGREVIEFVATYGAPLEVEMVRRVSPEPVCRTYGLATGEEILRSPYTNRYSEDLSVQAQNLNTLWSISGQPSPVSEFLRTDQSLPDGYYGFEWPIGHFVWLDAEGRERVSATWRLLGKEVSVESLKSEVPFCELNGEIVGCEELSERMDNRIFQQAVATVTELSNLAVRAKRAGLWKPVGRYRLPYFKRAAKALRIIRFILSGLLPNRYLCPDPSPPQCVKVVYPKSELLAQFESILRVKLPTGLRHLPRHYPRLRAAFVAELDKQPISYLSCAR